MRPGEWRQPARALAFAWRRLRATSLAVVAGLLLGIAPPAAADTSALAKITYLTSSTAYVDAGTEQGLARGATLEVIRDGVPVTTLEVTALSSRRGSCRPADASVELAVGDLVRFVPAAPSAPVAPEETPASIPGTDAATASGSSRSAWLRGHGVKGRIGLRYLGLRDRSGFGQDYTQPGLDVRLEGTSLFDRDVDFSADVRARRTYRTRSDGSDTESGRTRVYRLLGRWRPADGRLDLTLGRQVSTSLSSISIFDGVSAAYGAGRWSVGAFGGTQPDASDFGWSDRIREYGGWIDWKTGSAPATSWQLTTGFVASWDDGALNREHFVVRSRFRTRRLFTYVLQEIDLNRDWKREEEPLLGLTSTLVSGRVDVSKALAVDAGFDSRRAIRFYRNRITPETEFDDSYRQGYWGGFRYRPFTHSRIGLRVRRSTGGSAGSASSATATLRTGYPRFHDVSATARGTWYANDRVDGWLRSLSGGASVIDGRAHFEITGGIRTESGSALATGDEELRWIAIDLDARITRPWFVVLSWERSEGDSEESTQTYGSAVYRF